MSSVAYQENEEFFSTLFDRLFPILRSITGPGTRKSYDILKEYMPLEVTQVASGTKVFDWTVPQEWHCKEAYIIGPDGNRIIDMQNCNLHVLNYSAPIDEVMSLEDLQPHLYSMPDKPTAIPYVSSYYKEKWGFCMSQQQRDTLKDGDYHCVVKSQFVDGGVDVAQCRLDGDSEKEILLTSYMCHPSLANNELSGPLVLMGLYNRIKNWPKRRRSYRFAIHPETIGSLCMLHMHREELQKNVLGGFIMNMMGGKSAHLTYKHSLFKDGLMDKVVLHAARYGTKLDTLDFTPNSGADERHYACPGIRIPMCNVTRDFYSPDYVGYHNSMDTKEYMGVGQLIDAIDQLEQMIKIADECVTYENLAPYGEPQLGPRGLYPTLNFVGKTREEAEQKAHEELCQIKWLLTLSDGNHDAIDIAQRHDCGVLEMSETIAKLENQGLLKALR